MEEQRPYIDLANDGISKLSSPEKITEVERIALRARYGFLLGSLLGTGDPDLDVDDTELQSRAERMDRVIEKLENGIGKLEARMKQHVDPLPSHLAAPIDRIKNNKNNPLKNKYRLKLAVKEGRFSSYELPSGSFFYSLCGDERKHLAASFRPFDRTMFLSEDFDPENMLDLLIAFHENVHVGIDDAKRSNICTVDDAKRYLEILEFFSNTSGKRRMLINEEVPPYANELQAANIALGGMLDNPQLVTENDLMEEMNAREDQRISVSLLLRLAKSFFPDGLHYVPGMPCPAAFGRDLVQCHKNNEYEPWQLRQDGQYQVIPW